MSNLFASRLTGFERHYASLMSKLEAIEKRASKIAKSKDYNNLPGQGASFESDGQDSISVCSDIFWLLANAYDGYYDFAKDYFDQAPRGDHDPVLCEIVGIARDFDDLVEQSAPCEIDILARLWFYQIWDKTARNFEAIITDGEKEYYEISNFKHIAYVALSARKMLNEYFGYLVNKN